MCILLKVALCPLNEEGKMSRIDKGMTHLLILDVRHLSTRYSSHITLATEVSAPVSKVKVKATPN